MGATSQESPEQAYQRSFIKKLAFLLLLLALIVMCAAVSLSIGSYSLPLERLFPIVWGKFTGAVTGVETPEEVIVWTLRLPRIAMGILAGVGLGISGAAMQSILRNPLASPTTIGVSSAAGLGAALAFVWGVGLGTGRLVLIGNAFAFSMIPALVIFGLSRFKKATPEMIVLAGIGMFYIFSSLTSLLQYFAEQEALKSMVVWLMGDLGRAKWDDIRASAGVILVCAPLLLWKAWDLNLMGIGDETAKTLGVAVGQSRILVMLTASLVTATIICFTGMIGFIGLVAPHICRITVGGDNRFMIPAAGLFGAVLLLVADAIARTVLAPVIIPVGIITSCIGGPLFLYLIIKKRKEYWG
jgi:iron complex transport system permease protein